MLGLLHINFRKFLTEFWSLINVRISFPLNILRTNEWNLAKFCNAYALILKTSRLGLLHVNFHKVYNRVMALDRYLNFVSAQYIGNKLMEFDQNFH